MQSVKNTTVTIMLLFLSYGVYQIIMKPSQSGADDKSFAPLVVDDPLTTMNSPLTGHADDPSTSIPPEILHSDETEFASGTTIDSRPSSSFDSQAFSPRPSSSNIANTNYPELTPSSPERFPPVQTQTPPTQPGSFQANSTFGSNSNSNGSNTSNQFASTRPSEYPANDVQPSTVMASVAPRPEFPTQGTAVVDVTAAPTTRSLHPTAPERTLAVTWPEINAFVQNNQYQNALGELSKFYRDERLNSAERQQLLNWLDALAAKVIYSSEHHLRSIPYIIQPGDTIADLARQWEVPAQLIYNVNSAKIPDPNQLTSGVEIKLIQGPFDAEIDSQEGTMTIFLDQLYAGRFQINAAPTAATDELVIVDKSAQGHADRPFWIRLSNGTSIFAGQNNTPGDGEIAMQLEEAQEVFSILSAASKVRILR